MFDAGLDWLTMTWKNDVANFNQCKDGLENFGQELNAARFESKRANWQGYSGWQFGKIFLGERPDGLCLRASGGEAKLAEAAIRQRQIAGRATRCDLQITAKDTANAPNYGQRVFRAYQKSARRNESNSKANLAVYQSHGNNCGFVIGSRSSSRYHRFYNKTLEQRGNVEAGLWRYEVEFKGEQARYAWSMIEAATRSYWLAQSVVKSEFEAKGIPMKFVETGAKYERKSDYSPSSVEKSLNWFREYVRPSVIKLIEAGYKDAVIEALGLDDKSIDC